MTSANTGQHIPPGRHHRPAGKVDFTFMYAAHDAFNRDLLRLAAAVEAGRTTDPAVRTGWATFKNQLHVHHTAEDRWLWPEVRDKATGPGEVAVLDAMEAEHARIDPLLSRVDASLTAAGLAGLAENASALASALASHMEHEENHALPLVEAHLGPEGWAAFGKAAGKSAGLSGAAELFPWMLDGAPAATSKRLLGMLPPPARLLYRAVWRPRYARTPRWGTATTQTAESRTR
jgi:Hemerythrin HHE cation binding domain